MSAAGLEDLEGQIWRPLFEYLDCDVPVSFELAIPQRNWLYRSEAVGGNDTATSGVQESFVIRHDRHYVLRLRMTETEYVEDFEPMIRTLWGQAQEFTLQLDANDVATSKAVRLIAPWMGDGLQPTPHEYPGLVEVEMTVRSADGSAFSFPYFPTTDEVW